MSAARWWTLLGFEEQDLIEAYPLTSGASGSAVYRLLANPGKEYVLKVDAGRPREARFYRDLSLRVPVRVPRLVASAELDGRHGLLFESAGAPAGPANFPEDRWLELATELGGLHHARVVADVGHWPWAKREQHTAPDEVAWSELYPVAEWPDMDLLREALAELPVCLCHGDCHLGNLLLDPAGRFVWIDWQEVGFGRGPEDLALLWQRAEFAGLAPPRDAMLAAYAAARAIPDDATLHRAAVAAELILLYVAWSPFLRRAPEPARNRLLHRLERLLGAWSR